MGIILWVGMALCAIVMAAVLWNILPAILVAAGVGCLIVGLLAALSLHPAALLLPLGALALWAGIVLEDSGYCDLS